MARQVSEAFGLAVFRRKCADLFEANVLLEAQLAEVEAECEQLRAAAPAPAADSETAPMQG
jgi:hypothetical protein